MHCNICDREMSGKEITINDQLGTFEPCATCLDVIMDAANSGGFKLDDDDYETVESEFDEGNTLDELDKWAFMPDEPDEYRW